MAALSCPLQPIQKTGNKVLKTNNRIKLIVLSVSMLSSMASFAANNPADQSGNQVATADARQPIKQAGGQYQVRPGETLNQIAARVRPSNMSLSETQKAIIQANPDIFKNGNPNLIFAGDILRIPTGNQISGAPAASAKQAAPATPATPAVTKQATPPATDNKSASAKPAQTASSKTTENKSNQTTGSPVASAPAVSTASASSAASTASQEASAASPASESSGGSSLPWILIGGIGLAALLFLNKFRSNKQAKESTTVTPASKADKVPATSKTAATATTATVTAAAKTTAADANAPQTSDDDFSETTENLFFSDVDPRAEEPASSDDFNLDLGAIGNQQGIVSSAVTNDEETLKRADVDWDNLESTESVYEDDVPAPAAEKQPAAVSESEVEEAPVEFEDSVVEVVEATETETVTHTDEALEFEAAAPVIEETYEQPVVATQVITEPVEVETTPAEEPVAEVEAESVVVAEEEPLEFESVAIEPVEPAAEIEETTIEEVETSIEPVATVAEEAEIETTSLATEEEVATEKTDNLATDTGFDTVEALQDTQEENFNIAPIAITEASDDDVIEWESVNFADDDKEVGFISESVGMTAPLEAKYELAQMYIEIGDPDAARETLNELVDEANGDILEKSKALLAEIS